MGSPDHREESPCAICLRCIVAGGGQAIFTAECSHTFHFGCISDSVAHGHHMCPLCKAQWSELPSQPPALPAQPQPMDPAETIAAARAAAERGATQEAVTILENQQRASLGSGTAQIGDPVLVELGAELLKIRRQMRASTGQQIYYGDMPPVSMVARMSTPAWTQPLPLPRTRIGMGPRMSAPRMQVARMSAPPTQRRASSRQKRQPSAGSDSLPGAAVKKRKGPNTRSQGRK